MFELPSVIPDFRVLLELAPEELAGTLLLLLRKRGKDTFHLSGLHRELWSLSRADNTPNYPRERSDDINHAVIEALAWLQAQALIIPDAMNGSNGWHRLSRRARMIESPAQFADYRIARLLPRELLHPRIADSVWQAFMRRAFDVAVFEAMKAVEVSVREAAGFEQYLIGVKLMREAFNSERGLLADLQAEPGERTGRMELFAGAIASYKNPHSHRDVNLDNPSEALEIILLANHLLRIVDARASARKKP